MRISERKLSHFFKRHHLLFVSLFLALYSLHLALTYQKDIPRGYVVRQTLAVIMTPLEKLLLGSQRAAAETWSHYFFLVGLKEENDELKRQVVELRSENDRLMEAAALDLRLRELFQYKEAVPWHSTAAGIVAYTGSLWAQTVTVNKGASDGMVKDLAVITPAGVVGRIVEAGMSTSTVLLAIDVRSDIDVFVERTRLKGVVEGNGSDGMVLKYIMLDDDVVVGDRILTAGITGIYPKGLVVGEIIKIEKSRDNFFKFIEVRPAVRFSTLEDVAVITDTGFFAKD
ncbi:MAG: rod shape-determining protein MreC [Deltaproteobacteria bacterium RIFCSPLOWO2_02_FULL_53_8]|nr:MAG: rod shape-determining protein MreC [Deltaproteobacteria bacterium RIFCSPLOWO2_02_FULL_53_8]